MAIKRQIKADATTAMSSMTDIVFLLLIFFLITSTLINPNALKLLLPKSTGQVSAKAQTSVSIKDWKDGTNYTFHINGNETPIPFEDLEAALMEDLNSKTEEGSEPTFTIYSDETVPVKEVVALMNIAKRNNLKVIMATSPE